MGAFVDITGNTYGLLTVLGISHRRIQPNGQHVIVWKCLCSCGNLTATMPGHLKNGHTQSCGCHVDSIRGVSSITHGASRGKSAGGKTGAEYNSWFAMKGRCFNPRDHKYHLYGGRGVTVCAEWVESFTSFLAHIGPRPSPSHSVDRINVDGDYEPGNVRWATPKEQCRNRRDNHRIEFNGESLCLIEWQERTGIHWSTIKSRIGNGWSVSDALTKPVRRWV